MWRLVLTVSLLCCSSEGKVSCKDKDGKDVDWYILYKTPRNPKLTGLDYIYIYPDQSQDKVHLDKYINIADPNGVLANTLQPLFTPPPHFGYISYNDGVPKGYSASASVDSKDTSGGSAPSSYGHSKGVVMVQKDDTGGTGGTGVWLLHSTPKFPYKRDKNHFWPKSGRRNAQIFICVTFPYAAFNDIGKHLQYIRAFPFESHIPPSLELKVLQEIAETKNKNTGGNEDFHGLELLTSSGGKDFYSIAKQVSSTVEDGDLYVSISVLVDSDVKVQSWGCQPDRDGSFCSENKRKVQNVLFVKTAWGEWDSGSDHSKWCVAENQPVTCIADVNRSESQYKRLGGALCINDKEVTNIFKGFVLSFENCSEDMDTD